MRSERASLYVRTLAETGSIKAAAQKLYITPSALSKFITNLEKETGNTLFSRMGYHFVLTPEGERILEWLSRIDALYEQMDSDINDLAKGRTGKVRVGMQTSIMDLFISSIIPSFLKDWPGINLSVSEEVNQSIMRRLRHYELDFAISTHRPEDPGLTIIPLVNMEQVLFVHKDHPLLKRAVPDPKDGMPTIDLSWCEGESFVFIHAGAAPRQDMDRCLAPILGKIRIVMEVRTMRSALTAANQGIGIVSSCSGVEQCYAMDFNNLVKVRYNAALPPITYYLFYYTELHQSEAENALIKLTVSRFSEIKTDNIPVAGI